MIDTLYFIKKTNFSQEDTKPHIVLGSLCGSMFLLTSPNRSISLPSKSSTHLLLRVALDKEKPNQLVIPTGFL